MIFGSQTSKRSPLVFCGGQVNLLVLNDPTEIS